MYFLFGTVALMTLAGVVKTRRRAREAEVRVRATTTRPVFPTGRS